MSTDIVNLASIQDRVKQSVQSQFAGLITEGEWDRLIEGHVAAFLRDELPKLIAKQMTIVVAAELGKPEWMERWTGNGRTAGPLVEAVIRATAPDLVKAMFSGIVSDAVNSMRNQMTRGY
jgi:hypothetical protein